MKILTYELPNNLNLLHDELLAALPDLQPIPSPSAELATDGNPIYVPVIRVQGTETSVMITVPNGTSRAPIDAVVNAHDHTKKQPDSRADRLTRIREIQRVPRIDWTTAQMQELIDLLAQELTR